MKYKYNIGDIVKISNIVYKDKIGIITNVIPQNSPLNLYETIIAGLEGQKQYIYEHSIMGIIE